MKQWQREWFIFIVSLIVIFLGAREVYRYIVNKEMQEYNIRCDNSNADTFQVVLQTCLNDYISNENIIAMADTDDKMKAYKTLDEIIDISYRLNSRDIKEHDSWLEENIRVGLENYFKSEGEGEDGRYIFLRSGKKYQVWVLIQGSDKEGYTVLTKVAKKDPFLKLR